MRHYPKVELDSSTATRVLFPKTRAAAVGNISDSIKNLSVCTTCGPPPIIPTQWLYAVLNLLVWMLCDR